MDEINGTDEVQYNYIQTAKMIDESDSTLRYWVGQFKDILHLNKFDGKTIRFTKKDIENLRFIKKLIREDHYTIAQVREYCGKRFESSPEVINMDNQLQIKAFISALADEMEHRYTQATNDLLEKQRDMFLKFLESNAALNEQTKNELLTSVGNVMNETAEDIKSSSKDMMDDVVSKIETSNDKIKESVDSIKTDTMLNLDRLDKYIYEFNDATETLHKDIEAINNIKSVSMEQIKEYENRGLINKIRNLFK